MEIQSAKLTLGLTDANGEFTAGITRQIRRYEDRLFVRHACCLLHREPIADTGRDLDLTIRLRSSGLPLNSYDGVVVDENDEPVNGALVWVGGSETLDGGRVHVSQQVHTDLEGKFTVKVPGKSVGATAYAGSGQSEYVDLSLGTTAKLVVVRADATISGRVTDELGQPVTEFEIEVRERNGSIAATTHAISSDGRYRIPQVSPGAKRIFMRAKGFADAPERRATVEGGRSLTVDFVLWRGRTVQGVVIDEASGSRIPGASVRGGGSYTTADTQGHFELTAASNGICDIEAESSGYLSRIVQAPVGLSRPLTIALRRDRTDAGYARECEGIGVMLDFDASPTEEQGYSVTRLHPEGGALAAGIQIGDEILRVEETRAGSVEAEQFNALVKGPEGTNVKLTLRRDGREFELLVKRRRLVW